MRVLLIDLVPEERAAYGAIARGDMAEGQRLAALARTLYASAGPAWADREARMGRLVDLLAAEALATAPGRRAAA